VLSTAEGTRPFQPRNPRAPQRRLGQNLMVLAAGLEPLARTSQTNAAPCELQGMAIPSVLSHKTPCHPSPQKQIGIPAQLREPTRTPLLYSRPVTRAPRKTPEGANREEGGENAVIFLRGSRATGAPLSP